MRCDATSAPYSTSNGQHREPGPAAARGPAVGTMTATSAAGPAPAQQHTWWPYAALVMLLGLLLALTLRLDREPVDSAELEGAVTRLRVLRASAALLAGSALAVGGVLVQGLFRNPLASPSIIGTTAGATLGGRLAIWLLHILVTTGSLGHIPPEMVLPIGCVLGAFLALGVLLLIQQKRDDLVTVLLSGFMLSSLFLAISGLVTSIAQERWELARAMIAFSLGDVSGAGLPHVLLATPLVVAGTVAAFLWGRSLDLMLSGEEEAETLGVDVTALRRFCVIWTAVLTAAAVSVGGNLSFVGLVVPHALRRFVGESHRRLVPAAAILGGAFVIGCDLVTRLLPTVSEVPLGVVTGLIGAPTFLVVLLRQRAGVVHG